MKNRPADVVAFAAVHGFQDVHHLPGGINCIGLHAGVLSPGAGTRTATGGFSLIVSFTFHTIHNFGIFATRKPKEEKGGGLIPLSGQKIPISKRILIFQILNEIVTFIFLWVFVFPTLYRFRIPVSFIPERHGKYTLFIDICKCFSNKVVNNFCLNY